MNRHGMTSDFGFMYIYIPHYFYKISFVGADHCFICQTAASSSSTIDFSACFILLTEPLLLLVPYLLVLCCDDNLDERLLESEGTSQ